MVYVIPDNDNGGTTMWKTARKFLRRASVANKRIRLPKTYDAKGRLIKIDPGNMSQDLAMKMIDIFKTEHGFRYIL
jgi:hypothetical protein